MSLQPVQSRHAKSSVVYPVVQSLETRRLLSLSFSTPTNVHVGRDPDSVVVADFNGDGKPDMIVANYNDNNVAVLLGNGNGTFQAPVTYATGNGPTDVVAAGLELDGDGPLDLIVTNYKDNDIGILLGNGNGTFRPMVTYEAYSGESGPQAIAVGDLNGDGIPDIAVSNTAYAINANGSVSIFLGNGNGTFYSQDVPNLVTDGRPLGVAIADLNGDGINDLITADAGSSTVTTRIGRGNGTFQLPYTIGVGINPDSLAVADFNGDGVPDIVTANPGSNTLSVLFGNGNGQLNLAQTIPVGLDPESVTVSTLSPPGVPDLIVANFQGGTVGVVKGNAGGTFQPEQEFFVGDGPNAVATGDITGDGRPDILVANYYDNNVSILHNNGATGFVTQTNGNLAITGTTGNDTLTLTSEANNTIRAEFDAQTFQDFSLSSITSIVVDGVAGNDSISVGSGLPPVVAVGGGGADTIASANAGDTLAGGPSTDSIMAGTGNNSIVGGKGTDTLLGGTGNDTLIGGGESDTILTGNGTDVAAGGPGDDTIVAGSGNDSLAGGIGNDSLVGGTGSSYIFGVAGNNTIVGHTGLEPGSDTLIGGPGADSITGTLADSINGDGGADTINQY